MDNKDNDEYREYMRFVHELGDQVRRDAGLPVVPKTLDEFLADTQAGVDRLRNRNSGR